MHVILRLVSVKVNDILSYNSFQGLLSLYKIIKNCMRMCLSGDVCIIYNLCKYYVHKMTLATIYLGTEFNYNPT